MDNQESKKPKIALVLDELSVGGIPVACIAFLQKAVERFDITLILAMGEGEFVNKIPQGVRVEVCPHEKAKHVFKNLGVCKRLSLALRYGWWGKVRKRWVRAAMALGAKKRPLFEEEFDIAIAYHGMNIGHLTRTLFQLRAKKMVAWIHGDHPFEGMHKKDVEKTYAMFDCIYCVSGETKRRFDKDFPSLTEKTVVYYNHSNIDEILQKAQQEVQESFTNGINLVTVGRVSAEKGQDMIPKVLAMLLEKGYDVHWYIVGDGADRDRVERLVAEAGVGPHLTWLGSKVNPYPYMRMCDVYVQPSYTEGCCLTVAEAAVLGCVIVATDVGGTSERLKDGEEAVFTLPTPEAIAAGIERVLTDKALQEKMQENLRQRDFSNGQELEKLFALLA